MNIENTTSAELPRRPLGGVLTGRPGFWDSPGVPTGSAVVAGSWKGLICRD